MALPRVRCLHPASPRKPSAAPGASSGPQAEEFDVAQRQLRGNLPQAFVHALMLEAVATLAPRG
ncbi:hypothetical protein ACNPQM_27550 [Streptomyces sp. NPDC056231]|uniref:hypothetical protein n=1 Tax=Streptomyces sp. NPDC056231 TaxID=3345755 RepID=UPI003AAC10BC